MSAVAASAQEARKTNRVESLAQAERSSGGATQLAPIVAVGQAGGQPPETGTIGQPSAPYAGGQMATGARLGALGNRPVKETPFSVTSYTDKLIRDQQARTVADVTLNDPSVRMDAPAFSERDSFFIRGFSVTNLDTAYDGLFYITNPRRSPLEGIERVEVLKGPSALVNGGVGRVGGTINLVPKRATDEPLTRLTTTYMSDSQLWSHLDVGRRFGPEGEWGVRFNGSYRGGDTALDHNENEIGVLSLGLDYRGDRVRASLDLNHSKQNINAPASLFNAAAPGIKIPEAPDGRINTSNPFEYHDSEHNMVAGRVEFDVLENTTVYAAGGISRYREDFLSTSYTIQNPNGDALAEFGYNPQEIQGVSGEVGLRSEFDTGPVGHQLSVSVSRALNENNRGYFHPGRLGFRSYMTNIYNPIYVPSDWVNTGGLPRSNDLHAFSDLLATSVAISDTLSFAEDRFQLTVGGRYQEMRVRGYNTRPGAVPLGQQTYYYEEGRFSPAVAALVNVTDSFSVYGNYVEALTEGPSAPSNALNSDQIFPPVVSKQKEIGFKYDLGEVMLGAALFEIRQPNGLTTGGVFAVDGLQVNRGIELSAYGEPVDGVRLLGGITFMDAKLDKAENSRTGERFDGNRVPGVPTTAISLYGEYDTPWVEDLTLTGRLVYTGSTYYDQRNTQKVSDWTRVDLGARYSFERENAKPVEIRATVQNVFDENYWASSARGFLAAGAPRTFMVSTAFEF
ncbi:TonB-dependent receptor (plasmid) [Ensifer adhaerens]|uniref:TonB-dependent siderophore receptor n=2 Tax=Sinorhizobium/Ensifer group TaxID=227292 RepID=A0ABY8HR35_ENSAD|nr:MULTISPECIES: TonB-dependent siderophore receptor [Ensifer]ANK76477.1 TonB-dependent receptor [Ensifer adhaerens]KDP70493.1 TonB-dependent receptor [Ensifer adhaerens]KQX06229.1 TonB-dependent receptor [Ensifer sp. Root423]MBD9494129.1 TonB-dependent siderophore receptor [Ensifer sp. ENS01]MBD9557805.1 TonB-dependent siderophore receptor [Ensifer sp. ENS03]